MFHAGPGWEPSLARFVAWDGNRNLPLHTVSNDLFPNYIPKVKFQNKFTPLQGLILFRQPSLVIGKCVSTESERRKERREGEEGRTVDGII
jgi:hypothetical protein